MVRIFTKILLMIFISEISQYQYIILFFIQFYINLLIFLFHLLVLYEFYLLIHNLYLVVPHIFIITIINSPQFRDNLNLYPLILFINRNLNFFLIIYASRLLPNSFVYLDLLLKF
jgi:hypothetical protein